MEELTLQSEKNRRRLIEVVYKAKEEFKGAPKGTIPMIVTMFMMFVVGLVLITFSNFMI